MLFFFNRAWKNRSLKKIISITQLNYRSSHKIGNFQKKKIFFLLVSRVILNYSTSSTIYFFSLLFFGKHMGFARITINIVFIIQFNRWHWKFNTNHEIQILVSIFSWNYSIFVYLIDPEMDDLADHLETFLLSYWIFSSMHSICYTAEHLQVIRKLHRIQVNNKGSQYYLASRILCSRQNIDSKD